MMEFLLTIAVYATCAALVILAIWFPVHVVNIHR